MRAARNRTPWWRAAALALLWTALAAARIGDPVADKAEAAREEYLKGQYGEALRLYRDAQVEAPELPALHYNVGNSLVKTGDSAAALKEYEQALTGDPALRAQTRYNMGNLFYGQQDYQQAAQAYREALEADSGDRDAKANLELVLQQLQQQRQQNQQNQQGGSGQQGRSGQQQAGQQGEREDQRDQSQGEDQQRSTPSQQNGQPDDRQQQANGMRQQGTDPGRSARSGGRLDREEAEQLLDALADRERQGQMRRLHQPGPVREKDW
ncbi:MAG: tetratricopeptide repeat protein [Candidatus Latescibacterota bacterium]|jgi:Ca-activated chloride channel family protein